MTTTPDGHPPAASGGPSDAETSSVGAPAPFTLERPGATLVGERWGCGGPILLALHEGVADRRSWRPVARLLARDVTVVSYDRRGFGQTPPSTEPFSHVDDLLAVLDAVGTEPVFLAGTSAGGGVALEAAIVSPQRVAGLLLLAPGVAGAPEPDLDPDTARFDRLLEEAADAGDLEEVNRLETWLWLDGPSQPEGRIGGPIRSLALEMNRIALDNGVPEGAGRSGMNAWARAAEATQSAIVGYGDLDVPFLVDRCHALARRMPNASLRRIEGVAHLSELERPDAVAGLVLELLGPR